MHDPWMVLLLMAAVFGGVLVGTAALLGLAVLMSRWVD